MIRLAALLAIASAPAGCGDDSLRGIRRVGGDAPGLQPSSITGRWAGDGESSGDAAPPGDNDTGPPPTVLTGACPIAAVPFADPLDVRSRNQTRDEGTLTVAVAGWYHLYDYSVAESGATQVNESAWLRVYNPGSDGFPRWSNCLRDWVVVDPDNEGTPPDRLYMGTFWLAAGDNTLEMRHFCPRYRNGHCADLHNNSSPGSSCDANNANSVHFNGVGLCMVPAPLL